MFASGTVRHADAEISVMKRDVALLTDPGNKQHGTAQGHAGKHRWSGGKRREGKRGLEPSLWFLWGGRMRTGCLQQVTGHWGTAAALVVWYLDWVMRAAG